MSVGLPRFGVVVLTMGQRPDDLRRGLESLLGQQGVDTDIVVVGNGWVPTDLPERVRALALPENVGIPAGRNAGVPEVEGELLFFLDDDAWLPDPNFLREVADRFRSDPALGLIQPRVVDATGLPSPRRWVPRLRLGDPLASSPATSLWEGAVAMPRDVFEATGGWPDEFFYAHEGIDLVWRVWDAGRTPWYAADLIAHHPVIDPARPFAPRPPHFAPKAKNVLMIFCSGALSHVDTFDYKPETGTGRLVLRFARGHPGPAAGASADAVADRMADDPGRPTSRHLTVLHLTVLQGQSA